MGAGRVELGQDGRLDARRGELQRGPQARAAGADDDRLVLVRRDGVAELMSSLTGLPARAGRVATTRAEDEQDRCQQVQRRERTRPSSRAVDMVQDHRAHPEEPNGCRTAISSAQSTARQMSWFQRLVAIQSAVCIDGSKMKCWMMKCDRASTNRATPVMRMRYQIMVSRPLPVGLTGRA